MLFALWDYWHYRQRTGPYSRDLKNGYMGAAWEGLPPAHAIEMMQPGDYLAFQTQARFASWMILYFTDSDVSHVAFYVGEGNLVHSVPGRGVSVQTLEEVCRPDMLVLPCILRITDEQRLCVLQEIKDNQIGRPYGWRVVMLKAVRILCGRDWPNFRWRLFADVVILSLLGDAGLATLGQPPVLWKGCVLLFVVIVFNAVLWRFRPLPFDESTGKPGDIFAMAQVNDGSVLFDGYAIKVQVDEFRRARDAKRGG